MSKSTCPASSYSSENCHFSYFLKTIYVVGNHLKRLGEAVLIKYHNLNFLREIRKTIYLIIRILVLARATKTLS